MASDKVSDVREQLLPLLTHTPYAVTECMIRPINTARLSSIKRDAVNGGRLGVLDDLPLEILHLILPMLDIRSLLSIIQTCSRGISVVQSLREYRDLFQHAPRMIAALGEIRLLECHSLRTLHAAMLVSNCESCGSFGALLHLLICQRCCLGCLEKNGSLWLVSSQEAKECFELSAASLRTLPTMMSLPKSFWDTQTSYARRYQLISVKAAKALAIQQGRSEAILARNLEVKRSAGLSQTKYHTFGFLQRARLSPPGPESDVPHDKWHGMACISFPFLPRSTAKPQHGLWCLGCDTIYRDCFIGERSAAVIALGVDADTSFTLASIARTETQFWEHVKTCVGAAQLVPSLQDKLALMAEASSSAPSVTTKETLDQH